MSKNEKKTTVEVKQACCVVCKSNHDVVEFKGKDICRTCIKEALAM